MGSNAKLSQLSTDRGSTLYCSSFLKKVLWTTIVLFHQVAFQEVLFSVCPVMWSGCLEGYCVCLFNCSWRVGISLYHNPSAWSSPLSIIIRLVYSATLHLVNMLVHSVSSLFNIDVLCLHRWRSKHWRSVHIWEHSKQTECVWNEYWIV